MHPSPPGSAVGAFALTNNGSNSNTAIGYGAMKSSRTGYSCVAIGREAMLANESGSYSTAVGANALRNATAGYENVAIGSGALGNLVAGNDNIAIGANAGTTLTDGTNNIIIGFSHRLPNSVSNMISIGKEGFHTQARIAGIHEAVSENGSPVYVNYRGILGTMPSSARFKEDVTAMGDASSALMRLRPVAFRYDAESDPSGQRQYGLIAEEVEPLYPELVTHDADGRPHAVRYHLLAAMLLNELQKQQHAIEQLQAEVRSLARNAAGCATP